MIIGGLYSSVAPSGKHCIWLAGQGILREKLQEGNFKKKNVFNLNIANIFLTGENAANMKCGAAAYCLKTQISRINNREARGASCTKKSRHAAEEKLHKLQKET